MLNFFQVLDIYRLKIRDELSGIEGDEVARRKIEELANRVRPPGFLVSPGSCALNKYQIKSTYSSGRHQNSFC